MAKMLDFPVENWSDYHKEKLKEAEEDIQREKALGNDIETKIPYKKTEQLKKNISKDIKDGKLFGWLKELNEEGALFNGA